MPPSLPSLILFQPVFQTTIVETHKLHTTCCQTGVYTFNGVNYSVFVSSDVSNYYNGSSSDYNRVEKLNVNYLNCNILQSMLLEYIKKFNTANSTRYTVKNVKWFYYSKDLGSSGYIDINDFEDVLHANQSENEIEISNTDTLNEFSKIEIVAQEQSSVVEPLVVPPSNTLSLPVLTLYHPIIKNISGHNNLSTYGIQHAAYIYNSEVFTFTVSSSVSNSYDGSSTGYDKIEKVNVSQINCDVLKLLLLQYITNFNSANLTNYRVEDVMWVYYNKDESNLPDYNGRDSDIINVETNVEANIRTIITANVETNFQDATNYNILENHSRIINNSLLKLEIPPLLPLLTLYYPKFTSVSSGNNNLSTSGSQDAVYTYDGASITISASASVDNSYDGSQSDYARVEQINTSFLTGNILQLVLLQYVTDFNSAHGTYYNVNNVTYFYYQEIILRGPQGDTGPLGPTGSIGPKGDIGLIGPTGERGTQGGLTGYQGVQGYQGEVGSHGYQGDTGFIGSSGAQGYGGLTGSPGYQGSTGSTGAQGRTGSTG